ncbi:uncharacterized protein LOC129916497 [Episyrphus balteatus]|uniref:uncharacterized protein LOC129916497 n=1 Tax=Episyrphus balteatus TaxID=286459 RepID=UPI0024858702|nr:uncharacterized protein LOC129916497 [Episyrphus balteatus]
MSVNTSELNNQMENQMDDMCNYLEKLVTIDESEVIDDSNIPPNGGQGFTAPNKEPCQTYAPPGFSGGSQVLPYSSDIGTNPMNPIIFPQYSQLNYGLVGASPQHASNTVTSVLANSAHASTSTPRFPSTSSSSNPRTKKRPNYKQSEKDPDVSGIDIEATMKELGLTPESLEPKGVHKLFLLYSDLEFAIHAEYISQTVYDQKTIPNTLSVSAQTKFAVWSSYKLHRNLKEVLKRPMPSEYKSAFDKCEEALAELQQAIVSLDSFKHCALEHRKGEFITHEAEVYLEPLMAALNHLTGCVEKSRMYIQVYERALNAPEIYKPALLAAREEKPQPSPEASYEEVPSTSRPAMARRYIG